MPSEGWEPLIQLNSPSFEYADQGPEMESYWDIQQSQ